MKIFKELKKLGYIHYSATTIEELDDLPLNSAERVSEQALVLKWFREKYGYLPNIHDFNGNFKATLSGNCNWLGSWTKTYEEAELACLIKLIKLVKNK
jgi:hypothetical protein